MKNRELQVKAARMLAIDAINAAQSGHPGLPLGAAPALNAIFTAMKNDPDNPNAINRDRFVLSAGHGSAGLYATLHLFGYPIPLSQIAAFRSLGSQTPGHPEQGNTPGVDVSTGPLGQGLANAVGFAIAETHLAAIFNRDGYPVFDNYTYALCGEGCLMEGIGYEAISLAGTLKLSKLILIYDKNNITIEGDKDIAFNEDIALRFKAMHWNVLEVEDGNDLCAIDRAIIAAKAQGHKPTLIIVNTQIGYGSPVAGSAAAHGAPLKSDSLAATKEFYNWNYPPFSVPEQAYAQDVIQAGREKTVTYNKMLEDYFKTYPQQKALYDIYFSNDSLQADFNIGSGKPVATRQLSSEMLNLLADKLPNLIGGSADLAPSNLTKLKNYGDYSSCMREGRNLHFGIREHAMGAICNGIALYGGLRVFCSTFFVFSDYMKCSMRMSALMKLPVIYILTHDSIGVGEDGPTHEPIEQLTGLRSMPNINVFRPAGASETRCAYLSAIDTKTPTAIVLSRQSLPLIPDKGDLALKGGYIIKDAPDPKVILIGCGSELQYCLESAQALQAQGIAARVVSMPCQELFDAQSQEYKESVLPSTIRARIAVEAGASMSWYKYVGLDGKVVGIDRFGASGSYPSLFEGFGFTTQNVTQVALSIINKGR